MNILTSQKKKHANTWNIIIFYINKENKKKKNRLKKDKVQIENVVMRITKWTQSCHNKSCATSC